MKTTAFKFCTRGFTEYEAAYSIIVVHGISVTFIRIGSRRKPFCLLVPRAYDEGQGNIDAEDLARIAVAQSLRDGLFDTHPEDAVDLDSDVSRWDGELTAGT